MNKPNTTVAKAVEAARVEAAAASAATAAATPTQAVDVAAIEVVTNDALEVFDNTEAPEDNTVVAVATTEVEISSGLTAVHYV